MDRLVTRARAAFSTAISPSVVQKQGVAEDVQHIREYMQRNHVMHYRFNEADYDLPVTDVKIGQSLARVVGLAKGSRPCLVKALYELDKIKPDALAVGSMHPLSHMPYMTRLPPLKSLPRMDPEDLPMKKLFIPVFSNEFRSNLQ